MEKMNRINASVLAEAVNKIAEPTTAFDWNGINVTVYRVLPMETMMEFVDYVVKTCFGEEGEYLPEVKDFSIKSCLLEMYANFDLPTDLSERYAIIYNSDIVDAVLNHIEDRQFGEIVNAINEKISNMAQANVQMIYAQMNRINSEFENLQSNIESLFEGVTPDDMAALLGAVSNGGIDENKFVQAYASAGKNAKVVQMPTEDK